MSFRLKAIYHSLVGAWGGFLAWAILDVILRLNPSDVWMDAILNGAVVGMIIGALVAGFEGLIVARAAIFWRGFSIGWLTGIVGGILGLVAAEAAFQAGAFLGEGEIREAFRVIGWAIFGVGIGAAEGVVARSPSRIVRGGLGGLIGGLVGGLAFIAVARFSSLVMTNRAIGFALLGAFIGFFAASVRTVLREAWLQVVSSGVNEGKEFLLDKRVLTMGSAEKSDIALFEDALIAPKHAEIRQEGGQFVMYAASGQTVLVNDAPSSRSALQDGARLRVGGVKMIFRRRRK